MVVARSDWLRWMVLALPCAFLALGCGDDEEQPQPTPPAWQLALSELPGALISVWGSSASDVWAVGGDGGDGPMVVQFDGERFVRHATGVSGDLWWVHGFPGGPIFMGGKDGLILRYQDGAFDVMTTPGMGTVFGLWGLSPDRMWAVGGAGQTPSGGFVWRYDGESWSEEATTPPDLDSTATLFKVWGPDESDVWLVGSGGLILHYDGSALSQVDSPTTRTLFTVHGDGARAIAVGGFGSGVIAENEGGAWTDVTPPDAPQMTGVCSRDGASYAAGIFGSVMRRDPGGWVLEDTGLVLRDDFHGVFIDPEAGVWAVGGQVAAFPLVRGMLLYRGVQTLASRVLE
jgi:hypothetical protein